MGAHPGSPKIKKKESLRLNFSPDSHPGISEDKKERSLDNPEEVENQISELGRKKRRNKLLVRKQSNSSIRDELKFEKATLDLSHLGWIKEVKLRRIENR